MTVALNARSSALPAPHPSARVPQLGYQDSTQALLGGLEPFEFTTLPPAPHSRHSSNVPSAWGPLGAGAPAADASAAAAAAMAHRLPLLEEESSAGMAAGRPQGVDAAGGQRQEERQQVAGGGWEQYDRAHPVPGVLTVQHDGRLGVRQSLLDLEPFPDGELAYEQQLGGPPGGHQRSSSGGSGSLGGASSSRLAHSSGEPSAASLPVERSSLACSSGSGEEQAEELAAEPAPPAHFDPLGAVPHPEATGSQEQQQQQQGAEQQQQARQGWAAPDLLSLDDDSGGGAVFEHPAPSSSAAVRSQLEDLLL